jgi:tRNA-Thr(GGU) m(6)t(6)A37 methyltransferase TsaA
MQEKIEYTPIGIINTPFQSSVKIPIQTSLARDAVGFITIHDEFVSGLKDLAGFSHIILLYHFHLSNDYSHSITDHPDDTNRGVFATRSPRRPNCIGLTIVEIIGIKRNIISVRSIDIIDGTPLLDIKPYIEATDSVKTSNKSFSHENVKNTKRPSRLDRQQKKASSDSITKLD